MFKFLAQTGTFSTLSHYILGALSIYPVLEVLARACGEIARARLSPQSKRLSFLRARAVGL